MPYPRPVSPVAVRDLQRSLLRRFDAYTLAVFNPTAYRSRVPR